MTSILRERGPLVLVVLAALWFFGFLFLRVRAAWMAAKDGRGSLLGLMRDISWMFERDRSWTELGRLAVAWLLGVPVLMVVFGLVCYFFGRVA